VIIEQISEGFQSGTINSVHERRVLHLVSKKAILKSHESQSLPNFSSLKLQIC